MQTYRAFFTFCNEPLLYLAYRSIIVENNSQIGRMQTRIHFFSREQWARNFWKVLAFLERQKISDISDISQNPI